MTDAGTGSPVGARGDVTGRPDALRPTTLDDFVGQPIVVEHLSIVLRAAAARGELPDHMLFSGPPGLGKTTLAGIVAHELGLPMVPTSGPAIEKASDLVGLLHDLRHPSVVFVDEIHRLPRQLEEVLYPAMEDGELDFVVGEGVKAKSIRISLEPFVLIGATTQQGALSAPLRDRFGFSARLRLYSDEDLAKVVTRSAKLLGCALTDDGARVIALRSRGTPRVANALLRRARDWAQVNGGVELDAQNAAEALAAFGIDEFGLDDVARDILRVICERFDGGPVGLKTLAASCGEAESTVSDVYEPYLMHRGLLARTPKGRIATTAAYEHLSLRPPASLLVQIDEAKARGELDEPQLPGLDT